MRHAQFRKFFLPIAVALLFPTAARAEHFLSRRVVENGKERGIVVSHGMDLFDFRIAAGGNGPAHRSEIVAERLEDISESPSIDPESIGIGTSNGVVVLQQQGQGESSPHIILTIDRAMASQESVEKLARWWLALLRDHLALAAGKPPTYTAGTPINAVFKKIYSELGEPDRARDLGQDRSRAGSALSCGARNLQPRGLTGSGPLLTGATRKQRRIMLRTEGTPAEQPPPATAPDSKDPDTVADNQPRTRTGQNTKSKRIQVSGNYRVELLTNPTTLPLGEPATVRIKLSRTADDGSSVDEEEATVRAWFTRATEKLARPVMAVLTKIQASIQYKPPCVNQGDYVLTVGVLTDAADAFKVRFPFTMASPDQAGNDQPAGQKPPRTIAVMPVSVNPATTKSLSIFVQIDRPPAIVSTFRSMSMTWQQTCRSRMRPSESGCSRPIRRLRMSTRSPARMPMIQASIRDVTAWPEPGSADWSFASKRAKTSLFRWNFRLP